MFYFRGTAALAAIALAALPLAAQPAYADETPAKVASDAVTQGANTVVVGAFNVGFIFESVDNTKATGGMIGAFGGVTNAKSELVGVTPAMMQTITDAAYADFKAQLAARGMTVVDPAPMFGSAAFSHVKPMASPVEASVFLDKKSKGKTDYYKPSGIPGLVMLPGDIIGSGLSSMGMQMSFGYTQYGMQQHAKATGQSVIDVIYLIDFSDARRPGISSLGGGIKISSGMSISGQFSRMSVVSPTGKISTIKLKDPVAVSGDFADMEDTTKGGGVQKAANILGGFAAIGGFGGMKFGKSKTYTFTAKPGLYEESATRAATLANTRMVDQLVARQ